MFEAQTMGDKEMLTVLRCKQGFKVAMTKLWFDIKRFNYALTDKSRQPRHGIVQNQEPECET